MNITAIREARRSKKIEVLVKELYGDSASDERVLDVQMGLKRLSYFTFKRSENGTIVINLNGSCDCQSNVVLKSEDGIVTQTEVSSEYNAYEFLSRFLGIYSKGRPASKEKMYYLFPLITTENGQPKEPVNLEPYSEVTQSILSYMKIHLCSIPHSRVV